jgi:deoxyribodipyrimidine photo-lyase
MTDNKADRNERFEEFKGCRFPTAHEDVTTLLAQINPVKYAQSRNFSDGAVSRLSPYISRGFLSTRQVYSHVKSLGLSWYQAEKFTQELAWRDYWQQVWLAKGEGIHSDLKRPQERVSNEEMPRAVVDASTGIEAVDVAIRKLYETGYMHNHMRMYVASICCNIAKCHWFTPARWMYAHLLDGDLASNQLSWQWVAGAFSNKKYYANQDNINKYFKSAQKNTFLDLGYEAFEELEIPDALLETTTGAVGCSLPNTNPPNLDATKKTLVYNYYNLDPLWHKDEDVQRIFLLEPSVFQKHPVSQRSLDFAIDLSKNISNIKVFVGEYEELLQQMAAAQIVYKEHPLNPHYQGTEEPREWMSNVQGYFPSFFGFWKKCKKELRQ